MHFDEEALGSAKTRHACLVGDKHDVLAKRFKEGREESSLNSYKGSHLGCRKRQRIEDGPGGDYGGITIKQIRKSEFQCMKHLRQNTQYNTNSSPVDKRKYGYTVC